MADYFSHTLSGNLSGQTLDLRMTGGRLTLNNPNIAGAVINVEIADVDEALSFGGVVEGRAYGASGNRGVINITVTAAFGEYHAIENIVEISGQFIEVHVSGDIGGAETLSNAIKISPQAFTTWPKPSTKNCVFSVNVQGGGEEKFCYDSFARANFIRSGWITEIDAINNTVTIGTNGYIRLTGGSFTGMHLAINVTASGTPANNGKCYELVSGNETTKVFTLAAGQTTSGLTVGDFVSIGSMFVDNVIENSSATNMPHGMGAVLFAGCYRNTVRDFTADVPDGTYLDGLGANLPNKGFGTVALISSTSSSSDWGAVTTANTSYMGSADNTLERCHVDTNKTCQFNFEVIVNRAYDQTSQDYRLDYLPVGMPQMFGWRNRIINCTAEFTGVDAALGLWDNKDIVYIGNSLPVDHSAEFAIVAGNGVSTTYAVQGTASQASRVDDTVTITAWAGATIYYRWNGEGEYQIYIVPLTVTDQTSIEYYADGIYTESAKTLSLIDSGITDLNSNPITQTDLNGNPVTSTPLQ